MNPLKTLEKMLNKYKIISMMLVCAGVQANAETWQFVQDNLIFQPIDAVGNVHNVRLLTCEDRNKLTDNLITRVRDNDIQLGDITVRHELSGGQSLVA